MRRRPLSEPGGSDSACFDNTLELLIRAGRSMPHALMPVDVPETEWDDLQVFFATSDGDVRQNDLSDFTNVMRNGKIAMKLPEGIKAGGQ